VEVTSLGSVAKPQTLEALEFQHSAIFAVFFAKIVQVYNRMTRNFLTPKAV